MKIAVVESITSVGRSYTMANFADYLLEKGHDVTFFTIYERHVDLDTYLDQGYFSSLSKEHVHQVEHNASPPRYPIKRRKEVLNLVENGGFDKAIFEMMYLKKQHPDYDLPSKIADMNLDTYFWLIIPHPFIERLPENAHILTNSYTTRNVLNYKKIEYELDNPISVVYPPIDYSHFREASQPAEERDYDIVISSRTGGGKWDQKNADLYNNLENEYDLIALTDDSEKFTLDRKEIAQVMGNSRVYLSLSQSESASLSIYEAMNAQTMPVVYWCGAALEQIGNEYRLIEELSFDLINQRIDFALHGTAHEWRQVYIRGKRFGREKGGYRLPKALGLPYEEPLCEKMLKG